MSCQNKGTKKYNIIYPLSYFLSIYKQKISHGSDKVLTAVKFRRKMTKKLNSYLIPLFLDYVRSSSDRIGLTRRIGSIYN
jgi:hypothetical protein